MSLPALKRRPLAALITILAASLAACNSLLDTEQDYAELARVEVTGSSSVPLRLVLSNNFVVNRDEDGVVSVALIDADTQSVSLPINATYPLGVARRVLVRLINPSLDVTATVHMRVFLDADLQYDQQATMRDATLEWYFTYF